MERKMGNLNFADICFKDMPIKHAFTDDILKMIDWERIDNFLERSLGRNCTCKAGAKSYPAIVMFKILLLQTWFNLSDKNTEEELLDRVSFRRFLGISVTEPIPDHTTICRFRNLLANKGIYAKLLDELNSQLERQGKMVKKAVAIDGSVIESAARPRKVIDINDVTRDREEDKASQNNQTKEPTISYSSDLDADWTYKANKFHYGFKFHASVDVDTGLICAGHITPARHSDTGQFSNVVENSNLQPGTRVLADKGYTSKGNSSILKSRHLKDGIMNKAYRCRSLDKWQKKRNHLISAQRYVVERVFGTLKRLYGMARASYFGLSKVEGEALMIAMAYNLKRALVLDKVL